MTKTTDEIKKGLECCIKSPFRCKDDCPYKEGCNGEQIMVDALDLIQQLEADKIGLLESSHEIRKDMIARIQRLETENETLMNNYDAVLGELGDMRAIAAEKE